MCNLKAGKSPGVDNIPSKLLKNGGEATTIFLTAICLKIWETKKRKHRTNSLVIPLSKKGNLKLFQNYRDVSLTSHPSKIMLKITLNRLKAKAEELLADEPAGLISGRSTV